MIPEGRKKVLEVFHDAPADEFHIRDVARRAKIPVNNAHKYLYEFIERGFLTKRKDGNMTLFKVNLDNLILRKFLEYIEMEKTQEFLKNNPHLAELKKITKNILEHTDGVQMIFLLASTSDMFVVVSNGVKRPFANSKAITSVTLREFKDLLSDKKFLEKFTADRVTLYNEFLFWEAMSEIIRS